MEHALLARERHYHSALVVCRFAPGPPAVLLTIAKDALAHSVPSREDPWV